MALLIHGEAGSEDSEKYGSLLASLRSEFPDLVQSLLPRSANDMRRILRRTGLVRPIGAALSDIPIITLKRDFWQPHFDIFARKILLALHYQCFGKPLSNLGCGWHWIHTNVDFGTGKFPEEIFKVAKNLALPARQKDLMGDQLVIRWNAVPEHTTGIFVVMFHKRMAVSGITTEAPDLIRSGKPIDGWKPFMPV